MESDNTKLEGATTPPGGGEELECAHDWREEYYGHRCSKCGLFFAFGCAPWDADDNPGDDEWPEMVYDEEDEI